MITSVDCYPLAHSLVRRARPQLVRADISSKMGDSRFDPDWTLELAARGDGCSAARESRQAVSVTGNSCRVTARFVA
jgi:hypothetical protein